jgi:hypothetical protein
VVTFASSLLGGELDSHVAEKCQDAEDFHFWWDLQPETRVLAP